MDQTNNATPLPRWKCHKEVNAAKIIDIRYDSDEAVIQNRSTDGSALLVLEADAGTAFAHVSREFMDKHVPCIGGYLVVYEDGYRSFSPAAAFEGGYTRIFNVPTPFAVEPSTLPKP